VTTTANPSPQRLMQLAFGYAAPLIVEAALAHRIFDHLAAGPRTLEELLAATGVSRRGLRALADALVGLELLTRQGEKYALTPESEAFLVSGKPGYRGALFRHVSKQLLPPWQELTEIVRTGRPAKPVNQEVEGSEFFAQFVEDIFPLSYDAARSLAAHLRLAEARQPVRVLDLAAGSGVWGIALAQASPQVQVTAVDWPRVLSVTQRLAARHGVGDRFRFVAGDLGTVAFGSGYQVATLGHILHSEGEARSRALLRKTFAALAPGGTIAIAEWLVNDDRTGPPDALIFAVNMLVNTEAGDTFSFAQLRSWLEEAGFCRPRLLEVPGPSPLVLAERPEE
jgi:ubiquinone/menaquinone biosynthesis C-methylase UbiE